MAIIDFFDRGHSFDPGAIAFIAGNEEVTYNEAKAFTCRVANSLLAANLDRHAKCAVLAPNDVRAWLSVLGIWRAGMIFVPVNPRASPAEIVGTLNSFDCSALFYHSAFNGLLSEARGRLPLLKLVICTDLQSDCSVFLDEWLQPASSAPPNVRIELDEVVSISPTGGTTGSPKGVMNTHRSFQTAIANLMIQNRYPSSQRPVNLAAAPMTHTAGLLTLPTSARGGKVVIIQKPDVTALLSAIEAHKVTEFFLPPTAIYNLLESEGVEKHDYSSLKYFSYGAAPMSVERLKRAIQVFGPVMTGGYGQSEAPLTIASLSPEDHFEEGRLADDRRLSSVGPPSALTCVKVLDDDSEEVEPGCVGEICVRGDLVMLGYYKDQAKTDETLRGGWLHTGDLGHFDQEGRLHITDRKKDVVITGGFNVYPSEVEQVIWSHPCVVDCAVIGVPDEKWGESVHAVVEIRATSVLSGDELIQFCRERLSGVATPKSVSFTNSLPRSPVGKVLKRVLRDQIAGNAR